MEPLEGSHSSGTSSRDNFPSGLCRLTKIVTCERVFISTFKEILRLHGNIPKKLAFSWNAREDIN